MSSSTAFDSLAHGDAAVLACPRCGRENSPDARFCSGCGVPVAEEPPAGVRKTVTVLFCDLVGSTALGDQADPELLRQLLAGYHHELRTTLERHGGTVEKFVGDAVMAVFGVPRAHEDDALRAVRAALEMRDAVKRLGLEVRMGLNTGEVVAAAGESLVTGDAVNVAARLEQAAQPNEILLGATTHALVHDAVRAEPVDPLVLKGKAAAVPAHRLLGVDSEAAAITRLPDTAFIGRRSDLTALEDTLAQVVGQRSPRLVTLVGPPGIGKSRLAQELGRRSGARLLVGRCLPYGQGITYWPLAEMVSQVGDVRAVLGEDEEGRLAVRGVEAALGTVHSTSSEQIAWAFRRLFEVLASRGPMIVVFDDLQWAEPTLLDLVEYVATFARDAPLLLLCPARPDLFDLRPAWATPRPNASLISLEPLPEDEAAALFDELRGVPAEAKTRIVAAAEGNPLFVEQLAAHIAATAGVGAALPPTLQALLAARLDGLQPDERAVLERASIEGRLFHRGAARELLSEDARSGLAAQLMTLVRKGLIVPDRTQLPGDDGFRFSHQLIRDAAYDAMPKRLRAELHERFAAWLTARLGDGAPTEILGWHLERAYRYRAELAQNDERTRDLGLRAGRLLAMAGRRAHARGDDGAARSLLERATGLLDEGDRELPSLLALLGSSTYEAGDMSAALETLRRARAAAASSGQRGVELRARMDELAILRGTGAGGGAEAALAEVEAAIGELEQLDDPESLGRAWRALMEIGFLRSQFGLVGDASAHLLECARRAGIRREEVWAVRGLSAALTYGPTPVTEAIARVEQGLAEFPVERAGEDHLALLYACAGRFEDAEEAMARSRRVRTELGQEIDNAGLSLDLGWIALVAGRPETAEPALRTAAAVLERAGEEGFLASVAAVLADVLDRLEEEDEAEQWARVSQRAAIPEDVEAQASWRSILARVLARRGDVGEALRLSAEAVEWSRHSDGPYAIGMCLENRAEVLRLLGRPDDARPLLEEALDFYQAKGILPLIERTRAELARPELTVP